MSYIQFAQRYKVSKKKDIGEIDWKNEFYGYLGSEVLNADVDHQQNEDDDDDHHLHDDDDQNSDIDDDVQVGPTMSKRGKKLTSQLKNDDFIVEYLPSDIGRKMLPRFIPISTSNGVTYMQLSAKRVVRFHKFSQNKSPHEFYFSELQKFFPFINEEQLFPKDVEACKTFYEQNIHLINFFHIKQFHFLN